MRAWARVLFLAILLTGLVPAQVVRRGQLVSSYALLIENSQVYLTGTFVNRGTTPIEIDIPAGVRMIGKREPCLPALLGRSMTCRLPGGSSKTLKVEALSLSLYPHTAGPYEMDRPDPEGVSLGRNIQQIWARNRRSPLRNSPLRLCQAAAYRDSGQSPAELAKLFRPDELRELGEVLNSQAGSTGLALAPAKIYANSRYGFQVEIPTRFEPQQGPENGDGRVFEAPDQSGKITVYGSNNLANDTAESLLASQIRDCPGKIAYKARGKNWLVLSWSEGSQITYQKTWVGSGSLNAMLVVYPKSQLKPLHPVVARLESTFKAGDLEKAH